jgi:hypothetical protein
MSFQPLNQKIHDWFSSGTLKFSLIMFEAVREKSEYVSICLATYQQSIRFQKFAVYYFWELSIKRRRIEWHQNGKKRSQKISA